MIFVSNRAPKCDGSAVLDQNFNYQPFVLRPDLGAENFHRFTANPLPPTMPHDEKLPQINFLRLFAE